MKENKIVSLAKFSEIIHKMQKAEEIDENFNNCLQMANGDNYYMGVANFLAIDIIKLLELIFNDKDEILTFWIYQCDYGSTYYKDDHTIDGVGVKLSSHAELYSYLCGEPIMDE